MARTPIRAKLVLDAEARSKLEAIAKSRTEGQACSAETRILIVLSLDSLVCAAGTGGQPFSAHLKGNAGLPQDAAQPLRVRVHAQARVLAEPGGSLFRQDPSHVIEALGDMLVIKRMAGLHLYEYATVYEETCFIISDIDPVIEDLDALLLNHLDLGLTQFMGKCIFVHPLQEPWAQFVGHPKTAANDESGQWILEGHNFLPDSYLPQNPGRFSRG